MAAQYSYIGLYGEVVLIADTSINFRSAWSETTSYALRDAVTYNSRWFLCVTAHTGVTPPSEYVITTPTYWSPLVLVEGDPNIDDTTSEIVAGRSWALAAEALTVAWAGTEAAAAAAALAATGTDAADQAYSLAQQALEAAWAGTNLPALDGVYSLARLALDTAWTGTTAADQADALAHLALTTAWTGTDAANSTWDYAGIAFGVAVAGTDAAAAAAGAAEQNYALIQEARLIAEAGTGAAANAEAFALDALNNAATAQNLAMNALHTAWAGTDSSVQKTGDTMTGNLVVPNVQVGFGTLGDAALSSGTIYYDFNGSAYQFTTVDQNLFISAQNMQAGREIAVLLRKTGTSYTLQYSGSIEWFGSAPPSTISSKDVILALTSTGNTLGSVIGAAQTAV